MIFDTNTMTFTIPKEKIDKLLHSIANVLKCAFTSAKQLSKIAGYLSSMHMAVGPIVRLFTRHM